MLADGILGLGKSAVHHPEHKLRSGGTQEANQPGPLSYSLALF